VTLRRRILVGVLVLVAAGLLVADVATATALRTYLVQRVDHQLLGAHQAILRRLTAVANGSSTEGGARPAPAGQSGRDLGPSEFFVEILDPAGTPVLSLPATLRTERDPPPRITPALLHRALGGNPAVVGPVTEPAATGSTSYRVLLSRAPSSSAAPAPEVIVAAVSLRELATTFRRLVLVEGAVSLAVLVGIAALALWVVRLGLQPLDEMANTAGEIAAGNLSRRVEAGHAADEVGRLADALNTMLAKIEAAFTERAESEDRLRRFVADASHELRTPLTSIRGYAELFRHGAAQGEQLVPLMRNIEDQAARMGLLVDDLLLLARLDQHRPLEHEPVQLVALAAAAVADAHATEPQRPIRLDSDRDPVVVGDAHRIRQLIDNLLANTRAHTPAGAPVVVGVGVDEDWAQAVLSVRDAGPGMGQEVADRVFERFYRADPSRARDRGGSGLGLSIVQAVAEAHGGHATVTSAPGEGTTVTVTLPLTSRVPLTTNSQGGVRGLPAPHGGMTDRSGPHSS